MNVSIPSAVAVAAWAGLLALVATYTVTAYIKTAKDLPNGPLNAGQDATNFGTPIVPDIPDSQA